jgi:type IV secretory pathway component VirB8
LAAKFDTVNWQSVDVFYQPYAGYFSLADLDLTINYKAA